MYPKDERFDLPETVEEAVDLLVSDLLADHLETFSGLNDTQFDRLYARVSPYILSEFRLWSGNDRLLNDCISQIQDLDANYDPAHLILLKTKVRLQEAVGVLIVT